MTARWTAALSALAFAAACAAVPPPESANVSGEDVNVSTPADGAAAIDADAELRADADAADTSENARLYAFFEREFEKRLARSPMDRTFLGQKIDYDKWDDLSDAYQTQTFEIGQAAVARMRAEFNYDALDADAQRSYRLFEYQAADAAANWPFRRHGYVFNQMSGRQSAVPAFLINQHRVDDVSDAEAYIARLRGVRTYLGQAVENARASAEIGVRPPKFVYDYVRSDAANVISGAPFAPGEDSPIYADFKTKANALDISGNEKIRLIVEARNALLEHVAPAYADLIAWIDEDGARAGLDDGVWKLPDGAAYYQQRLRSRTTTPLTADEIHTLGLAEVARIHEEMRGVMDTVGLDGDLGDFFAVMRSDPQFYYADDEAGRARYLSEATALIAAMEEALPDVFNVFPKAELVVKRVEPFREQSAGKAFYQRPAPDGSRPGVYYANLYRMADMPTYQMEALAYHEAVPGHHMQLAIAQELENIPQFRKYGGYTAYIEGWGLYSEYLPKEMGFYADPYSDFGRLAMELWRAARLVVDTGLHHKKWSRAEATQYLIDNTPNPPSDCAKAIDRYIVLPGQATAYKIGMLKILELRDKAELALEDRFDIAAFHDVVLADGAVPLSTLETAVDDWIAETAAAAEAAN